MGGIPDAPPPPNNCDAGNGGGSGPEFSYIWIANSGEGTVSKINTVTMIEEGRYLTRGDGWGDPSRTSVSLNGDVAVANRNGGLVKFLANTDQCVDRNGDGTIQTSTGPNDVLAWDDEECRAWFTPFDYQSQRPVAWTPGQWNQATCRYDEAKVWTSGSNAGWGGGGGGKPFPGDDGGVEPPPPDDGGDGGVGGNNGGADVVLVNGDTGEVEEVVNIPEIYADGFGLYGGAVDEAGNFFGTQLGWGTIVRVHLSDLSYDTWSQSHGGYGMTVDSKGRLWTCDWETARLDPDTSTWQTVNVQGVGGGGCMEDATGILWLAGEQLIGVDTDTLDIVANYQVGQAGWEWLKGISIDFQGYVWAVPMSNVAYRVDPDTGQYETVSGLNSPYTYSDMTGFALANAGGWTPAG